jgi:hypothetical protein
MELDLANSPIAGVRWQAQMEEHLATVRALTSEALLPGIAEPHLVLRAGLAQAHATAALALSVANTGGDLELALGKLSDSIEGSTA